MKVPYLKKQINKNLIATAVIFVALGTAYYFYYSQKHNVKFKIQKIEEEANQMNMEAAEVKSKVDEITKYQEIWDKIPQNRKDTSTLKSEDVNKKLSAIASKYSVGNESIKLSLPEAMKGGIFDRKTINVMMTTANVTFTASSDVSAIAFANEFISSLKGYPIVTSFKLNRDRDYSTEDLVSISQGKSYGLVQGKLDFTWYVYKEQENKTAQSTTATNSAEQKNQNEVKDAPKNP